MRRIVNYIITGVIAVLSLLSVALLWKDDLLLTTTLLVLAAFLLLTNKSKEEIKIFIFCAFFGTLSEVIVVHLGAWTYGKPNILGIPFWLMVAWGIASVFIVRVYLLFKTKL